MKIELKPVTHSDHPAVHEVYRQCADFLQSRPGVDASRDMALADIEESGAESGLYCGIYHGKRMIGVVSYVPSLFEFRPVDAFILLLMIIPAYRRKGVGSEVLSRVEKDVCARGRVRSICCDVPANSADAIRFFQKHGYYQAGGPETRPDSAVIFRFRKDIERGGQPRVKPEV